MPIRRARLSILLSAMLATAACSADSPTEASAFSGEYELDLVDQQPLPFVHLLAPLTGDTLMIVAADVHVLSRGRLRLVRHFQWRPRNASPGPVTTDTLVRSYREDGGLVLIDHPSGGPQGAFTDTVQVLNDAIQIEARIVLPIAFSQAPPIRRTMFYVRP